MNDDIKELLARCQVQTIAIQELLSRLPAEAKRTAAERLMSRTESYLQNPQAEAETVGLDMTPAERAARMEVKRLQQALRTGT